MRGRETFLRLLPQLITSRSPVLSMTVPLENWMKKKAGLSDFFWDEIAQGEGNTQTSTWEG